MDLAVLAAGPSLVEAKPPRDSQRQQRTVMAERGSRALPQPQRKLFHPQGTMCQWSLPTRQGRRAEGAGVAVAGGDVARTGSGSPTPPPSPPPTPTTLRLRSRVSELQLYKHREKANANFQLHYQDQEMCYESRWPPYCSKYVQKTVLSLGSIF